MLRRGIAANAVGQGASAVLALAVVPIYLGQLGAESYGLIGFFLSLQAIVAVLDLGLGATTVRQVAMAKHDATAGAATRPLVRTMALVYAGMGLAIAAGVAASSDWIARDWLAAKGIPLDTVHVAILVLGVTLGVRWPVTVATSVLRGLERVVLLNGLLVGTAAIRHVGTAIVLIAVSPTLLAYLACQLVAAGIEVCVFALAAWRSLPPEPAGSPRFLWPRALLRFSATVALTALCAAALKQLDRLLISGMLPLDQLGYYTAAAALSTGLTQMAAPLALSAMPRLSALVQAGDEERLADTYHRLSQVAASVITPCAAVLACFPAEALFAWTRSAEAAAGAGGALRLLAAANLLNAIMQVPYALQLATGANAIGAWTNSVGLLLLAPVTIALIDAFGTPGGAAAWCLFNAAYYLTTPPLLHRRVLRGHLRRWYVADTLPFALASVALAGGTAVARPHLNDAAFAALAAAAVVAYLAVCLSWCGPLRDAVRDLQRRRIG